MSSFTERWRGRLLRRRTAALLGIALLSVVAVSALAGLRGPGDVLSPVAVKREDLVLSVEVEGELAAVRSTDIGAPPVTEVEFKISLLAPEGSPVKAGQPILGFDTETLQRQLVDKQAELAEFTKKVEQKEVDLRLKLLEIEQQVAQAEADLGKAQLKAEVPPDLQQRVELEKARLDHKGRQRDLENLQAERRATQSLGEAELRSLRNQRDRARGRVEALQAAIEKMTVKAPQDGIVVYRTNWRDEKKKVGDSMWFGETVLALPDLSEMRADGLVDEADGGGVAAGQKVTIRLEARPDLDVHGRVKTVGRTVRQKSWRNPVKVYKVDIALDRTDSAVMRPAMRFRGEIETGRIPGLLLAPRDAVFLRGSGPVVWTRRGLGWTEVPVRLGRSNRRQVEIVAGLEEGDRLSPTDLAAAPAEPRRAPAGAAR
ncbi:MAG TPA: HlyD family efflux transporter periplasmic adaptor subunit [Vicinamibacteria bacterium]|nr:HlyD family efflux transporter periplasmic adaptor subunit [Vicinamibacteria bacterium]